MDEASFEAFLDASRPRLLRTAYLLTHERPAAEDLLQEAMARAYLARDRVNSNPEAYVRKIMMTTYINWRRRRWRGEVPTDELPEPATSNDAIDASDQRLAMWQALAKLPRKQQAVLVLRYYEDMTEAQTAEVLGVGRGTVKSQASKALRKLRNDKSLTPSRRPSRLTDQQHVEG